MATKNVNKTRLLMKHDIEANWLKAENFIPLEGEIVVYDADETHSRPRMKIGDGTTKVGALSFVSPETIEPYMQLVTNADGEKVWEARTHYSIIEPLTIIAEQTVTTIEDRYVAFAYLIGTNIPIVDEEYTILFNGVEYKRTAYTVGDGYISLGNLDHLNQVQGEDPFVISWGQEDRISIVTRVGGTYTISVMGIQEEVAKKLDNKFLNLEELMATDDEIMELMASLDMLPVVTDESGAILTDENSNILLV